MLQTHIASSCDKDSVNERLGNKQSNKVGGRDHVTATILTPRPHPLSPGGARGVGTRLLTYNDRSTDTNCIISNGCSGRVRCSTKLNMPGS